MAVVAVSREKGHPYKGCSPRWGSIPTTSGKLGKPRLAELGCVMTFKATVLVVICLFTPALASGVVIRHDVPEKKYLDLAAQAEFRAGLVTVLDPRGHYTGVLISSHHVLTVGHPVFGYLPPGESNGPLTVRVRFRGDEYETEYAYLHPRYDRIAHRGGADLAVIRLKKPGITDVTPAIIWSGGVALGTRFIGVGQGKSGTGRDKNEPKPMGTFRGYENTIDFLFDEKEFLHFRSDFDDGTDESNTLARVLFGDKDRTIRGQSLRTPLPLEGTTAAGDSGSGVWIQRGKQYYLAGIASYRYFSAYGGQAGYVNLSYPTIIGWLKAVALVENEPFQITASKK
jgi:hypothetical protein